MMIQINTDHNVDGREALSAYIRSVVETAMGHLASHLTRVEVHLTDVNGGRTEGEDKRCLMEARLEGRPPAAVSHHAATVHDAVNGAADKLAHLVGNTLGRLHHVRGPRSDPQPSAAAPVDEA